MQRIFYIAALIITGFNSCCFGQSNNTNKIPAKDSIVKIEMNLSAFGVESDDFPSIEVYIDLNNDSSICNRSFFNPAYKNSTYFLSKDEIKKITTILMETDLEKLKKEYTVQASDQPSSTTTIYTPGKTFVIKDYGLKGDYPLQALYKIVYKL